MRGLPLLLATLAALGPGLPAPAPATTARVVGLNVAADFTNDPTAMFTFLTAVTASGSHAYLDAGSVTGATGNGDRAMGAVLADLREGRAGVWAIHLRQLNPALGQPWIGLPIVPGYLGFDPNRRDESLDLAWGGRVGGADVAARLQRSFNSSDNGSALGEGVGPTRRNVRGAGLGLGFELDGRVSIEVSGQVQGRAYRSATQLDDGGMAYLFAARARSAPRGNLQVVPVVKFYRIDLPWIVLGSPVRNEVKVSGWLAGGAANWAAGRGDLLILGASVSANTFDVGAAKATETLSPAAFVAIESSLGPWLTVRAGARQTLRLVIDQRAGAARTRLEGSAFSFSTGASVGLGRLALDAALDPAFFSSPLAQLLGSDAAAFEGRGARGGGAGAVRAAGSGPGVAFPLVSLRYAW